MKVVVLGAGYVGNVIARDLAEDPSTEVSVVDINQDVLDKLKHDFGLHGPANHSRHRQPKGQQARGASVLL